MQNTTDGPEKTLQTAKRFNEFETRMIAIQQTQNIKIHKLEERYNETESKLESYQNTITDKLKKT